MREQTFETKQEEIKKKVQEMFGVKHVDVKIEEYRIDERDFYEENRNIWDKVQENPDCVTFPEEKILQNALDENMKVDKGNIEGFKKLCEEVFDMDEDEITEKVKDGVLVFDVLDMNDVVEKIQNNDSKELNQFFLDNDEYYDWIRNETTESLAYWTIYFKPDIEDVEVALKCRLTPFYYDDELYLALGGCGLDLKPKLDAYQMLTSDNIPAGSNVLRGRDNSYFEYVVGKDVTKEALEKCKRDKPRVSIEFDLGDGE
jgi:hypothetical protein